MKVTGIAATTIDNAQAFVTALRAELQRITPGGFSGSVTVWIQDGCLQPPRVIRTSPVDLHGGWPSESFVPCLAEFIRLRLVPGFHGSIRAEFERGRVGVIAVERRYRT